MKKVLGLIFNRWTLLSVGLLALATIIWVVGPLIAIGNLHPLESEWSRWTLIGVIVALVVSKQFWSAWRARKASEKLVQGFAAQAAATPPVPAPRRWPPSRAASRKPWRRCARHSWAARARA
jgi:type VI secretion system protein ImpL